jgi:hypothetical protein
MQIQRLLLRLQQMLHPVLHNERRVKACCILGIFWPFSLLAAYQPSPVVAPPWPLRPSSSPRALPRSTRRRAPASLHPPSRPLLPSSSSYPGLAPSSAAPPSPSASALAQIRWCGQKDRGPGQRWKDRQCGIRGPRPRRHASSPQASLSRLAPAAPLPELRGGGGGLPAAHGDLRLLLLPRRLEAQICGSAASGESGGTPPPLPDRRRRGLLLSHRRPPPPCSSSAPREATAGCLRDGLRGDCWSSSSFAAHDSSLSFLHGAICSMKMQIVAGDSLSPLPPSKSIPTPPPTHTAS